MKEGGFTLIELMIVIAIIGILAAIGLPMYNDYLARAQMAEPVGLMDGLKSPLSEWYGTQGSWPTLGTDLQATSAGKYTSSIAISSSDASTGALTLTATMHTTGVNTNLTSKTVILRTTDGGGSWTCTAGSVNSRYLPYACR
ncbi:MAG: prepilin-type N-terminal cleavage/methylation domain-containing protein [Magnetococcales bacterium]|nr:pilin [Magnetococcales bacterium]NGZ26222.1 prepilin-type N-terminal cleavage/methylation domain-containing protein [Magnetococcales bacterium]